MKNLDLDVPDVKIILIQLSFMDMSNVCIANQTFLNVVLGILAILIII
jgi:hypothetical protein